MLLAVRCPAMAPAALPHAPSMASLGVLKPRPTFLYQRRPPLPGILFAVFLALWHTTQLLVSQGVKNHDYHDPQPYPQPAAAHMHANTLKPAVHLRPVLLLVLTATHRRFTPSCFWNALSVCKNNVKVNNALQSSSRQRWLSRTCSAILSFAAKAGKAGKTRQAKEGFTGPCCRDELPLWPTVLNPAGCFSPLRLYSCVNH